MNSDGMSVTGLNVFHLLKELTTKRIFNYDFIHKPELTIKGMSYSENIHEEGTDSLVLKS